MVRHTFLLDLKTILIPLNVLKCTVNIFLSLEIEKDTYEKRKFILLDFKLVSLFFISFSKTLIAKIQIDNGKKIFLAHVQVETILSHCYSRSVP